MHTESVVAYCRHLLSVAFSETAEAFGWNFTTLAALVLPWLYAALSKDKDDAFWETSLKAVAWTAGVFIALVLVRAVFYVPFAEQRRLAEELRVSESALAEERRVRFALVSSKIVRLDEKLWATQGAFRISFVAKNTGQAPARAFSFSLVILDSGLTRIITSLEGSSANEIGAEVEYPLAYGIKGIAADEPAVNMVLILKYRDGDGPKRQAWYLTWTGAHEGSFDTNIFDMSVGTRDALLARFPELA